jgi:enhancing lycopene biosynthesis protein 2
MKTIGVVLSGCGVYDGAEIHEAVLTLLALDRAGARALCLAPDAAQHHVINHLTGAEMPEQRNVLVESARIARGDISDIAAIGVDQLDGLIFPGGFGAAKNLCTFALDGPNAQVHPEVDRLVRAMHAARKPIGFACIAPVIGAKVLGASGVSLTIGNDPGTAAAIASAGARHVDCPVREMVADADQRVVSTPAYMLGKSISEVAEGIERMVQTVVSWA